MPKILAVTGSSNNRRGKTEMRVGMIRKDGYFIVRELHNHFRGVKESVQQRYSSTSQGRKASQVLGDWVTRSIDVPDGTILVVAFTVKSSFMSSAKELVLLFEAAEENAMMEFVFPVVTDQHSTILELPLQGRLRLMDWDEVYGEDARIGLESEHLMHKKAMEFIDSVGNTDLMEQWKYISSFHNHSGDVFLNIEGSGPGETWPIKATCHMAATKKSKRKAAKAKEKTGKVVKTSTGGKAIIASRRRKIRIQ
jgi:hypothetical protein